MCVGGYISIFLLSVELFTLMYVDSLIVLAKLEEAKEDGSIPFLDTIIRPEEDGSFAIGVYRKPTHTDLYLPWDSNHNIAAKLQCHRHTDT